MKTTRLIHAAFLAFVSLLLASSAVQTRAQTIITNTYLQTFDNNGNSTFYTGYWDYWYNFPGGDQAITNDPTMDASNNPSSGSMMIVTLHNGYTQNVFFGTFAQNAGNRYDFSVRANLLVYSNISFDIRVAPGTPPDSDGSYGNIGVGIINHNYGYQEFGRPKIPAAAVSNWVHLVVPIDKTQDNISDAPGICFDINNFTDGYPAFTMTNWIDNVAANAPPAPPPPPPTLSAPQPAISGLNCIAGSPGVNDRDHIMTVGSSGYSFPGQTDVTYSWTIKSFPPNPQVGNSFYQQHLFIVTGTPGPFDQAADYNLPNCIFVTVQQGSNGNSFCTFRYKTNEPSGNGMLFNQFDSKNGLTYPTNGSPRMPIAVLNSTNGALGTWSLHFNQSSNVTITAPDGSSTNFIMNPTDAAIFSDPVTLCLGGQANGAAHLGKTLVLGHFSAQGCALPIDDAFTNDATLDTTTWRDNANDTNCVAVVSPDGAFWVPWSLPDQNFTLQTAGSLKKPITWNALSSNLVIKVNSGRQALVNHAGLLGTNQNYFSLVKRVYSKLLVLLDGETFAPGTTTGKTGTPNTYNIGDTVNITVIAVDASNFAVPGVTDTIAISSSDSNFVPPLSQALQNGQRTFQGQFGTSGTWTVTATDVTNGAIPAGTSSNATVN